MFFPIYERTSNHSTLLPHIAQEKPNRLAHKTGKMENYLVGHIFGIPQERRKLFVGAIFSKRGRGWYFSGAIFLWLKQEGKGSLFGRPLFVDRKRGLFGEANIFVRPVYSRGWTSQWVEEAFHVRGKGSGDQSWSLRGVPIVQKIDKRADGANNLSWGSKLQHWKGKFVRRGEKGTGYSWSEEVFLEELGGWSEEICLGEPQPKWDFSWVDCHGQRD